LCLCDASQSHLLKRELFSIFFVPLAKDIPGYLEKGEYIGWRTVVEGKHSESAYFAYFDREIGVQTVLVMRKIKNGGPYKPYAIIDAYTFSATKELLQKGTPL
jgi:hypothetical protein